MIVPGMYVCISFPISACMFVVSKALLLSTATVIVRAWGAIWLNPLTTVLFNVCSSVTVECCVCTRVALVCLVCLQSPSLNILVRNASPGVNCLVKYLSVVVILLLNIMVVYSVVGGALLDRPCIVLQRVCVLCL